VNFVPEGGIWMNTQRPEWNDANNAMVGKGLSIVTLCYLRRYIAFCKKIFSERTLRSVAINSEVYHFYYQCFAILNHNRFLLQDNFNDKQRREVMNALGGAGSEYRWNIYEFGFSGEVTHLEIVEIVAFLDLIQEYVDHTLRKNKRLDDLYHAYNILHMDDDQAHISCLYEMLEGQVAILSSGLLSDQESLALLRSLRQSSLYQAEQNSYLLYPERKLPSLFDRNCMAADKVRDIALFTILVDANDKTLVSRDVNGVYHFNGQFHNIHDLNQALKALRQDPDFSDLVTAEITKIQSLFEETFHHDEFTGRSGTFFAYEGLGSIYWHMVSKLLLAVQETIVRFKNQPSVNGLIQCYFDIRAGLGFNKTPNKYGAFPTDPYSHTPKGQGAKQPGMTGLVKEEILTRMVELGLNIDDGQIIFDQLLLDQKELLSEPSDFRWLDVAGQSQSVVIPASSLAYTFCQVPIILLASQTTRIEIFRTDGGLDVINGRALDKINSQHIFMRDGFLHHICVYFTK
jgi:hypothetical protein